MSPFQSYYFGKTESILKSIIGLCKPYSNPRVALYLPVAANYNKHERRLSGCCKARRASSMHVCGGG